MFAIIDAHQLECVPVSINKHTLSLDVNEVENAITPFTKAILITHLFGALIEVDELVKLARKHNLIVIEDCAQAFNGQYIGNPNSDVSLFSFGLIKTNTCLTGAMVCFTNRLLFEKVNVLNQLLPVQRTKVYIMKIFKALAIITITGTWIYTLLYRITKFLNKDFDEVLAPFTKGFPGVNIMEKISFRPCQANLHLLQKRTSSLSTTRIERRKEIGLRIMEHIPRKMCIGQSNIANSYWVFALESEKPVHLIAYLRANGIDATAKASSLISINNGLNLPSGDELNLERLVYIPNHKNVAAKLKFLDLEKYG